MASLHVLERPTGALPAARRYAPLDLAPVVSRPESAPRTTALPEQAVQPRGVTRRQWRSVAKTALGVGLGALALTGFGGSRALKVHTALGLAFVALSLWHVSLYKPHKKNCA